jgi:tetratricopeptide (TPR) repeat protein
MHIVNWLLRFILIAFLVSCTSTPPAGQSSRKGDSTQGRRDEITQLQTFRPQIRSLLERREFLKPLRLMQQQVNLGLSESSLAEEYALALRGGMIYSEELSGKERFSECGIYLQQLVNLYPRNLPALSGVSAGQIRQKMSFCSDQLMVKGLAAYRAGQMQEAINFWTALLVFNPERTEAEKAIDTCSIQLRNLKPNP